MNFATFLRTPFLHNTSGQLLLSIQESPLQDAVVLYSHHVSVFLHTFHVNVPPNMPTSSYDRRLKVKMKSFPNLSVIYSSTSLDIETFEVA